MDFCCLEIRTCITFDCTHKKQSRYRRALWMKSQYKQKITTHVNHLSILLNVYRIVFYFSFLGNYIHDFKLMKRKTMTFTNVFEFSNVSSSQCAKLCIEQEGSACRSFAYCNMTSLCRLTSSHPRQSGNSVSQSDTCDLYSSNFYVVFIDIINFWNHVALRKQFEHLYLDMY